MLNRVLPSALTMKPLTMFRSITVYPTKASPVFERHGRNGWSCPERYKDPSQVWKQSDCQDDADRSGERERSTRASTRLQVLTSAKMTRYERRPNPDSLSDCRKQDYDEQGHDDSCHRLHAKCAKAVPAHSRRLAAAPWRQQFRRRR